MKKKFVLIVLCIAFSTVRSQVGINNPNPKATLDIVAKETGKGFRLQDGNQGNNKVLTCDADGLGTWKELDIPVADNNFKLSRVYTISLGLTTATDTNRTVLLGTLPSIEVTKPNNFIICQVQSPTTIINSTLQSIAYQFRLNINNTIYDTTPINIISNSGFTDTTQIVPYSFYLNQYPIGTYKFDIYGIRRNSTGSNASSRSLYFNSSGELADEKKGLVIVYVYEK